MVFHQKTNSLTNKENLTSHTHDQSSVSSPMATLQRAAAHPGSLSPAHVFQLQQTVGNRSVSQLFSQQRQPVIQRKIDDSEKALYEEMQTYKNFPKSIGKSFRSLLTTIYSELRSSPNEYEVSEIAQKFAQLNFDEEKISKWRTTEFLEEQRTALDEDILHGDHAHGGKKHLDLTEKEQKKRLLDDDKPRGTSVKMNKDSLGFMSNIKYTLRESLVHALTGPCLDMLDGLRGTASVGDLRTLAGGLNATTFETEDYHLSFQFTVKNFNNQAFDLSITPTLRSKNDFEVSDYTVTSKTHYKTKEVKKNVDKEGDSQKQLSMFWGSQKLNIAFSIFDTENTILQKLEEAVHGGVTLF